MEVFCVKHSIHYFDTVDEFVQEFLPCEEDLILTESIIFEMYFSKKSLPCVIILKDKYDPGEPKEETIDAILSDIPQKINRIFAIGGGSVIDIAKLLCVKNAFPIKRVINHEIPIEVNKELVVLPTTCGTGSEVTYSQPYCFLYTPSFSFFSV